MPGTTAIGPEAARGAGVAAGAEAGWARQFSAASVAAAATPALRRKGKNSFKRKLQEGRTLLQRSMKG
jgi:hypothetical protein